MILFLLYIISIISGIIAETSNFFRSLKRYKLLDIPEKNITTFDAIIAFDKIKPSNFSFFVLLYSSQIIYVFFEDKYVFSSCILLLLSLTFLSGMFSFTKYNKLRLLIWGVFDSLACLAILFCMLYFFVDFVYQNPVKLHESDLFRVRFVQ